MKKCKEEQTQGSSVIVKVDVTRIVRCLCFTGIVIVGIIFGTKCWREIKEEMDR